MYSTPAFLLCGVCCNCNRGKWDVPLVAQRSWDIEGKTIGTHGAGRIGREVMKRLEVCSTEQAVAFEGGGSKVLGNCIAWHGVSEKGSGQHGYSPHMPCAFSHCPVHSAIAFTLPEQ